MNNNNSFFIIGVIVFLSIILFIGGNFYLQNKSFNSQNYTFNVFFENIQGLHEGDEVKILGKKIGKVKTTRIDNNRILAELIINNAENRIPIDSKIEVKSEGLLGTKYISITLGKDEDDFILAGSNVFGTYREVDFSEITQEISPITQDLAVFSRQLKVLLGDEEISKIKQTIVNIESLTHNMDEFTDINSDIISKDDKQKIKDLIANLSETSSSLKYKFDNDISNIISNIDSLSGSALEVKELTGKLNDIIVNLERRNNTLGKLIYEDSLYVNMNELIKDARGLVQDIEDNPAKYLKSIFK